MDYQTPPMPTAQPDLSADLAAIRAELAALRAEVAAVRRDTSETSQMVDGVSVILTLLAGQIQRAADRQQD